MYFDHMNKLIHTYLLRNFFGMLAPQAHRGYFLQSLQIHCFSPLSLNLLRVPLGILLLQSRHGGYSQFPHIRHRALCRVRGNEASELGTHSIFFFGVLPNFTDLIQVSTYLEDCFVSINT